MTNAEQVELTRDWPQASDYRKSIRTEFSLLVAGMMVVIMMVFGYVITDRFVSTVSQHVVKSLLVQARSSAVTATNHLITVGGADKLMLNNICNKLKADNPELYWVGVAGSDNTLVSHTDVKKVIAGASLETFTPGSDHELLRPGEVMESRSDTMFIVVPIEEDGLPLGRLAISTSMRAMHEARQTSIFTVVSITGLSMLLGIPFLISRLRKKLRPITDIANGIRHLDIERMDVTIPYEGQNEMGYLAATLRAMGSRIYGAQQQLIEKERLAQELQMARDIQANLLPRSFPRANQFQFAGMYRSAQEVGGDYYDFIDLDDQHLAFVIADVSGKSLRGMLIMLITHNIVKRLTHKVRDPAQLLSRVNRELMETIHDDMFVTMMFGVLHKETGRCEFASAGHNSFVRVVGESGSCPMIKTKGFPLGLVGPETFEKRIESGEVTLKEGDWLVLYTDGINEAINLEGQQFGVERLLKIIQSNQHGTADDLIANAMEQHEQFVGSTPQFDDMTLLALKWQLQMCPARSDVRPEVARA